MKSEKGITLISLIIYIIVMLSIVTLVATISSYFFSNVNKQYEESKKEYNEANIDVYFTNDLKNKKLLAITDENLKEIGENGTSSIKIVYEDGSNIAYTIKEDGIYRNYVRIFQKDGINYKFKLQEIEPTDSIIHEKMQLNLVNGENIVKSYVVNIKSKAVYQAPTGN